MAEPLLRGSVLVVDDHPGVAGTTAEILGRAGLGVVTVSRGEEADLLALDMAFDVVILDYDVPFDRPVEDVVIGWSKTSCTILVTAADPYALAVFADRHRNEVFAALSKPVDPDELIRVVGRALTAARSGFDVTHRLAASSPRVAAASGPKLQVTGAERVAKVRAAYGYFNAKRFERVLGMLDPAVEWPDVVNDTVIVGRDAVGRYWAGHFARGTPTASARHVFDVEDHVLAVVDHQSYHLDGSLLGPASVMLQHFEFRGPLIRRMWVEATFPDVVSTFFRRGA
jgi:CheY-like chemotaxis protein